MNKDALINIIINDLKEVELLMEAFRGEESVKPAFIDLAKRKVKSIEEELSLLGNEFGKGEVVERISDVKHEVTEPEISESVKEEKTLEPEKKVEEVKPEPVVLAKEEASEEIKELVSVVTEEKPEPVLSEVETELPEKISHKEARKNSEDHARLGDVLQKEKSALNDRMTRKSIDKDMQFAKPVTDVRKAMGINDRFLYQRELFGGNSDLFNQTLEQINSMNSFEDARSFLMSNFAWDTDNDTAETFLNTVKRRFL